MTTFTLTLITPVPVSFRYQLFWKDGTNGFYDFRSLDDLQRFMVWSEADHAVKA